MGVKEFLNKLEKDLKELSKDKVVDISNLSLQDANFLINSYDGLYHAYGPAEDENNPGKYVISFSLLKEGVFSNA